MVTFGPWESMVTFGPWESMVTFGLWESMVTFGALGAIGLGPFRLFLGWV